MKFAVAAIALIAAVSGKGGPTNLRKMLAPQEILPAYEGPVTGGVMPPYEGPVTGGVMPPYEGPVTGGVYPIIPQQPIPVTGGVYPYPG